MNIRFQPNTLYYGDCLEIMADLPDPPIQVLSVEEYFRLGEQAENLLRLLALTNPWTGKEMHRQAQDLSYNKLFGKGAV